ncbi:MAG: hypothetical protein QW279_05710 [Candidatus Jordarchaeaceae archaeon]
MSSLDVDKVDELVEHPEYFLVGTVEKRLAWSLYLPFRIVAKRADYIHSFRIPSVSDHKLSGVASAAGTAVGITTRLFTGIGFEFSKGTSGYITFRNCFLKGGQIVDFPDHSVVAMVSPFDENSVEGGIYASVKGLVWKNKVLTGIEFDLKSKSEEVKRSIKDDETLISLVREFFEIIVYWTAIKNLDRIRLEIKDINGKKYNITTFTLLRPTKGNIDFLREHGKDFRKIPELTFEISKNISEKMVFTSLLPPPPPPPPPAQPSEEKKKDQNIEWL